MSFRDQMAADIHGVFLNTKEFAVKRTIRYDGAVYSGVDVVLNGTRERTRQKSADDYSEGFYARKEVAHLARADLGGRLPEIGQSFDLSEDGEFYRLYRVKDSQDTEGMLRVELEVLDE